ncbi:MAG: type III-A CRISPR-associated RAMP protein Csm3 [Candidatus Aminicenantes bacterium]|nr:type III-A CRISPR-associated RAMP protein Csm3 [Candidatus Aminicenantes bacterium]
MNLVLKGKVVIKGEISVLTGLRIGGSTSGLKIGGIDLNVITDPHGRPYIPGSSLKGKLRTLIERKKASENPNFWNYPKPDESKQEFPNRHMCQKEEEYKKCPVCKIWGILGKDEIMVPTLTRLMVCDAYLDESSITKEMKANLELEWTEVKFETAINRITGTALSGSLRQVERVPAGARFKDVELIYNVYEEEDKDILKNVFIAMELLEHDYLGGMGSRGYGRVAFKNIEVYWNKREDYESGNIELKKERIINPGLDTPQKIVANFALIRERLI